MKQFKFSLSSVLQYRAKVEENEKNILAGQNRELSLLYGQLRELLDRYKDAILKYEEQSARGMTAREITAERSYIGSIERSIEKKEDEIEEQRKLVARQTAVVVRATQETKTLDKLKEHKYRIYGDAARKEEELFIEEFVSNQAATAK